MIADIYSFCLADPSSLKLRRGKPGQTKPIFATTLAKSLNKPMNSIKFKLFLKGDKSIKMPEGHRSGSSIRSIEDCLRLSAANKENLFNSNPA
jgi:hypothetical protein